MKLVLATHNAHKIEELRRILGPQLDGIELVGIGDAGGGAPEPVENGETFAENALIKARAAAAITGLPSIADDSGICVDALDGAPGIHSARYAGTRNDADNVALLLENLTDVTERAARFECAAALVVPVPAGALVGAAGADGPADPDGLEFVETGVWPGTILYEPAGSGGFGYDPVFKPAGYTVSAAELRPDEKNAVSHRALAFGRLIGVVREQLS